MAPESIASLTRRVTDLEKWQSSVAPMLRQLAEDQAYRARWLHERQSSRARWRRAVLWVVTVAGGIVVVAESVVQLARLL